MADLTDEDFEPIEEFKRRESNQKAKGGWGDQSITINQSDAMGPEDGPADFNDYRTIQLLAPSISAIPNSEDEMAIIFADQNRGRLKWVEEIGKFYVWNGMYWEHDIVGYVPIKIRDLLRAYAINSRTMSTSTQRSVVKAGMVRNVMSHLKWDIAIATKKEVFDQQDDHINTTEGIMHIDPEKPDMYSHDQTYLMTRMTSVAPDWKVACPVFMKFLMEIFDGDVELINWIKHWMGYCLLGRTDEQILVILYGPGGNGKGTFARIMSEIMGTYAGTSPTSLFTKQRNEKHSTELARLNGLRFVVCEEMEQGDEWDVRKTNSLTGGNVITAHFMGKDDTEFRPKAKFLIITNHLPRISVVNNAARRRYRIVHLPKIIPVLNKKLEKELRDEYPHILAWMLEGALNYVAGDFNLDNIPEAMRRTTSQYFGNQDSMGTWIEECCETHTTYEESNSRMFKSWEAYAKKNGEYIGSQRNLIMKLSDMGYEPLVRCLGIPGHPRGLKGIRVGIDYEMDNPQDREPIASNLD